LRRFRAFVNDSGDAAAGDRMYVMDRQQIRPATAEEIAAADPAEFTSEDERRVLISGAKLPVGAPASAHPPAFNLSETHVSRPRP
ncbi:MAG: hypothetical protein Q3965_06250, partial [Rothia sp. (in: high G+C Gram-positive bacteria)]|nr:hypothetical protein [Rothia sp. (in: high G+C Gram-positive bacteria)]